MAETAQACAEQPADKAAELVGDFQKKVGALEFAMLTDMEAAAVEPRRAVGLVAGVYINGLARTLEIASFMGAEIAGAIDHVIGKLREEVARRMAEAEAEAEAKAAPPRSERQ